MKLNDSYIHCNEQGTKKILALPSSNSNSFPFIAPNLEHPCHSLCHPQGWQTHAKERCENAWEHQACPLDEKSHDQSPGNKLREKSTQNFKDVVTVLAPNLGQIKFYFVVQEFSSVEGLGAVEKADANQCFSFA